MGEYKLWEKIKDIWNVLTGILLAFTLNHYF
jgi:hypothetical protein